MTLAWTGKLPFGIDDLKDNAALRYTKSSRVGEPLVGEDWIACCIKECPYRIRPRIRGEQHQYCPTHNISMSKAPTYVYRDAKDNIIVGLDLYRNLVHKAKDRLANENSEDAVSWNVFVGLLALGGLRSAFRSLTGFDVAEEPHLYLWGNRIKPDAVEFWDRLRWVQQQLERHKKTPTEPDVILHVPGKYLVVIEAKFESPNNLFKKTHKGIKAEDYFSAYRAKDSNSDPLNREWIYQADSGIHDQLCRNAIFAHWLAGVKEIPILANLVQRANEIDVAEKMKLHLRPNTVSFRRRNWEDLYYLPEVLHDKAGLLRQFMKTKTCGLKRAFDLGPADTDREGNEFFSIVDGVKTDAHLHDAILNEVDPVAADKLARENARRRGYTEEQILTLFGPPLTK